MTLDEASTRDGCHIGRQRRDFHRQDAPMAQLRTANKRHKRAIASTIAHAKAVDAPAAVPAKPVKTAR
jgi:hypothetical protein